MEEIAFNTWGTSTTDQGNGTIKPRDETGLWRVKLGNPVASRARLSHGLKRSGVKKDMVLEDF